MPSQGKSCRAGLLGEGAKEILQAREAWDSGVGGLGLPEGRLRDQARSSQGVLCSQRPA